MSFRNWATQFLGWDEVAELYNIGASGVERAAVAISEPTTWNDVTRSTESFWRAAPFSTTFQNNWTSVQFTGPEIQASANQTGAFTAALATEYQRLVNDARNSFADNLGYNQLTWRGKPIYWDDLYAPKPPLHDAWLMDVEGL